MTVAVQTPYTSTVANGSTKSFPYNFKVLAEEDLEVKLDGVEVTSGFTVTGVGSATGGTVDWPSNLTANTVVLISLRVIPKRDTTYPQFGDFPSDVVNDDIDRLWLAISYLRQLMFTAIRLPFDTAQTPWLSQSAVARALKYIGFDVNGAITLADIPDLATTQAAQAAAEAAAATIVGFEPVGAYTKNTQYYANNLILGVDTVTPNSERAGTTYRAVADFVSTNGASDSASLVTDISLGRLVPFAARGASGSGTGDLLAAQNLNDVADKPTARTNLGLGTAATKNTGTGTGDVPLNSDILGKHTIWIPAGAMKPQTSAGPAVGSVETTTHKVMISTLDFDYSTRIEYAQFAVRMPKSWNAGALQAQFVWSCAAGATAFGCVWAIQARAFADTEALDQAWGTAVTVTDTATSTGNLIRTSDVTADITPSGTPAKEEIVLFQVYRIFNDAADTLDKDARLHGVVLFYTPDALNDA